MPPPPATTPLPRRRLALILCLAWALWLHGGGGLADAFQAPTPARRPGMVGSSYAVGSRPVPAAAPRWSSSSSSSASEAAARFADDKRRIPSCPDALHNR
uniref:CLAVATA3/ESR-like protein n=1 Tax=Oryza meridionalis TaxID=40149 RepID=A0A0E0BWH3_9ORYZ